MNKLLEHYQSLYNEEFIDEDESHDTSGTSLLHNYTFKLPLEYHDTHTLDDTVKSDIEFSNESNLFNKLLNHRETRDGESLLLTQWSSCYTTNKKFLKDNQKLLASYQSKDNKMNHFSKQYVTFKEEQNFLSRYQYVQFRRFFYLNTVVGFLQILAVYNICSPILSLMAPLIGLMLPYFIFYFKGIRLSFAEYTKIVKTLILNNNIIKNLLNFHKTTIQQKGYALVYLVFYCMGFYNNVLSCIQFYKNTNYMIELNDSYSRFLDEGNHLISHIHKKTKSLKQFKEFNNDMMEHQKKIRTMTFAITSLKNSQTRLIKCGQIGLLMKSHFDLYYNQDYHNTIMYLIYLDQYHKDMTSIASHVQNHTLNPCTFVKRKGNTKMKQLFYLSHIDETNVKNDVHFNKNIIITGPNASGKTTILKSVILNLFLSQSIGFGCYDSCRIKLYDYFHSYLNIPDTSNRDSLFQAEARRCKRIYEHVEKHKKANHLCIFDEIYSGTNPSDAVLCASVYLQGMNAHKSHMDYILTTHYLELCSKYKKSKHVKNQQMNVNVQENDEIQYTYTLGDGISEVHGGFQILKKMDYPEELLNKKEQESI